MEVIMKMPDLATTGSLMALVRWFVEPGQTIARGQALLEVETEKAIMEVESVVTGTLKTVAARPGDSLAVGQVIAVFDADADAPPSASPVKTPIARPGRAVDPAPAPKRAALKPESLFARNRLARETRFDRAFLLGLYERMVMIREFEEGVKYLFLEGSMPGTIHQCQGQEATAVGVCAALEPDDFITSTFRGTGHALAKGLSVEELLFELFGASSGCCRGKGGSMHMGNMTKGMVPGIAIVGGGVPLAAGMALAFKMQKRAQVVACFFGDGAVAEGAFHEGVNLAAIWNLPVVYVCENNLYGASTRVNLVMRNHRIAERAASYGIRGETVDGNDVLAVYEAARAAVDECRRGEGPVLLELLTYRRTGHSRRDACHYQPKDERDAWHQRDPIVLLGNTLVERELIDQAGLDDVKKRAEARFKAAVERARREPMPDVEELERDVMV
jgi:pyruvate dehydrogenase E1 component alpha subunit